MRRVWFSSALSDASFDLIPPCSDASGPEIILTFEDGTEARADVLVGADGIRSPTRKALLSRMSTTAASSTEGSIALRHENDDVPCQGTAFSDLIDPVWSGTLVYRYLIPAEALEALHPAHRASLGPVVVCPFSTLSILFLRH